MGKMDFDKKGLKELTLLEAAADTIASLQAENAELKARVEGLDRASRKWEERARDCAAYINEFTYLSSATGVPLYRGPLPPTEQEPPKHCSRCSGKGWISIYHDDTKPCPDCDGTDTTSQESDK